MRTLNNDEILVVNGAGFISDMVGDMISNKVKEVCVNFVTGIPLIGSFLSPVADKIGDYISGLVKSLVDKIIPL